MGCDIHLFVEVRKDGKWTSADKWSNEYGDRVSVAYKDRFYSGRNYDLFGILADVRNGHGFAGVDTGDGFVPICEPKGLPSDVTKEVSDESASWGADGHSHSYFTVQELLDYDWTQVANHRGIVSPEEFEKWSRYRREEGEGPESWCGGVGGRDTQILSTDEMDKLIKQIGAKAGEDKSLYKKLWDHHMKNVWARIQWSEPYYDSARYFLSQTIFKLLRLGKPEDVRIVFWFDN